MSDYKQFVELIGQNPEGNEILSRAQGLSKLEILKDKSLVFGNQVISCANIEPGDARLEEESLHNDSCLQQALALLAEDQLEITHMVASLLNQLQNRLSKLDVVIDMSNSAGHLFHEIRHHELSKQAEASAIESVGHEQRESELYTELQGRLKNNNGSLKARLADIEQKTSLQGSSLQDLRHELNGLRTNLADSEADKARLEGEVKRAYAANKRNVSMFEGSTTSAREELNKLIGRTVQL
ncbi:hypothetical protein OAT84_03455 [Gammaproteobacteria bacterium]|nr:hypothetical protein [Gammaproteobacteria bacterium]